MVFFFLFGFQRYVQVAKLFQPFSVPFPLSLDRFAWHQFSRGVFPFSLSRAPDPILQRGRLEGRPPMADANLVPVPPRDQGGDVLVLMTDCSLANSP